MTDQELILELRNSKGWPNLGNAAADRIEQLAKERDAALVLLGDAADNLRSLHRAEVAEAELAEAVGALRDMLEDSEYWSPYARATLAELEGK